MENKRNTEERRESESQLVEECFEGHRIFSGNRNIIVYKRGKGEKLLMDKTIGKPRINIYDGSVGPQAVKFKERYCEVFGCPKNVFEIRRR